MLGFKKNQKLNLKLEEYLEVAKDTFFTYCNAYEYLLNNSIDEHFSILVEKVSKLESNADDIRREIEFVMYEQSLMPETRGALLNIIEMIDKIPNRAEHSLNLFTIQRIELKNEIKEDAKEMLIISKESFIDTIEATLDCFGKMENIEALNTKIDNNESIGDKLERKMLRTIFSLECDLSEKIIQKEMIVKLAGFCDLCESVMDLIVICSVKRKI